MVDYLLANTPHFVYGMVRRTAKPDYSNLTEALKSSRFKLVVGDLSDSGSIDFLVKDIRPDYFINLGAQSFVGSSWALVEQTIDVSGTGVARCLEAVRKHVPHCRFYSAGSSEQWGNIIYSPQDEEHPMRPRSPYGCAKCLASHIVKVYRESYGLYAVHGILLNHEGIRRGAEFVSRKTTLAVARIARAIKDGVPFEPLKLGNLDAKRDWSDATDFVDGIWRMLNQEEYRTDMAITPGPATEIEAIAQGLTVVKGYSWLREYVLASGETHTVRSFVEKAFAVAGISGVWWNSGGFEDPKDEVYLLADRERPTLATKRAVPLVQIDPVFYRPAEVDLLLGNSTRARTELGWSPKVSFDELVRRMVTNDLAAVGITPLTP